MEGLSRITGAPVKIKICGEDVLLDGMTIQDYGAVEQEMLKRRREPIAIVAPYLEQMPEAMAEKLLNRAYKDSKSANRVSAEELQEWIDSLEGVSFCFWLKLEQRYPNRFAQNVIWDWFAELDDEQLEQLKADRDAASGLGSAGNSIGPAQRRKRRRARRRRRKR